MMKRNLQQYSMALLFFFCFAFAVEARGATEAVNTSIQKNKTFFQSLKEKSSVSYIFETTGPTLQALDGVENDGHQVNFAHYIALGYKLNKEMKLGLTQYFTNSFRSESEGRNLGIGSPYVTLSHSNLYKKGNMTLSGYVRYYVPLSTLNTSSGGTEKDEKNGKLRFKLAPSFKINDKVSVAGSFYLYKPLARYGLRTGEKRRDYYVYIYPNVSFKVSDKFSSYVAYSNIFTRYSDVKEEGGAGIWGDWDESESLEVGAEWNATKKLTIAPYINFNAPKWVDPSSVTLSFYAIYSFL